MKEIGFGEIIGQNYSKIGANKTRVNRNNFSTNTADLFNA